MRVLMYAGVTLSLAAEARSQFDMYEQLGMTAVKHTAFVLVAGGLGERLGYSGIKVRAHPRHRVIRDIHP
jgi:UDP-N-acetylglucosamine pyrophosphorylase